MKYLTLGLAAAILSFTTVSASPAPVEAGVDPQPDNNIADPADYADDFDYTDAGDGIVQRANPAVSPASPGTPNGSTGGGNGTDGETDAEKAEDAKWKAYDAALDQNECARNAPHGFDQQRLSNECKNRWHGDIQTIPVINKEPIVYLVVPTDVPKDGKLPKPAASTLKPSKATLFVCGCKVSELVERAINPFWPCVGGKLLLTVPLNRVPRCQRCRGLLAVFKLAIV